MLCKIAIRVRELRLVAPQDRQSVHITACMRGAGNVTGKIMWPVQKCGEVLLVVPPT